MAWMNAYDVINSERLWSYDPVLGPASRTLYNLMMEVDAKSDGWASWRAPRLASRKLQDMLTSVEKPRHGKTREELRAEYKAALVPLKSFRTRKGMTFMIEEARG
jgi:hypothetical protein